MQLKKHLGAVSKQTALIGRCWGEMLDNVEHTLYCMTWKSGVRRVCSEMKVSVVSDSLRPHGL